MRFWLRIYTQNNNVRLLYMEDLFENKVVAIIGSSGELDCNDYSDLIKDADVHVRINCKLTKDDTFYLPTKNTGQRTDVIYSHGCIIGQKYPGRKRTIKTDEFNGISEKYLQICESSGVKAIVIPNETRYANCKRFETDKVKIYVVEIAQPKNNLYTSGINAIIHILSCKPKKLYIIGIDCHQSKNNTSWYGQYLEISKLDGKQGIRNNRYGSHDLRQELCDLCTICNENKHIVITEHLKETFKYNNLIYIHN